MDISWLGHACVRVRTQRAAVVMDPCDKAAGFDMGRPTADIVTVSNPNDPHHSNVRGVRGDPLLIEGPGEYEIRGVQITAVRTLLRPPVEGEPPVHNTVCVLEAEDLALVHLGGLGAPLTAEQSEQLSNADILVLPIGGAGTLDAQQAARIVRDLEPTVVIPVLYPVKGEGSADGPLRAFIDSAGVEPETPGARLAVHRRGLGDALRVVLLKPRG